MVRSYNKTIENKIKARNRMNKNEILKTINKLSNNAMFNVSLTSRELFHTNFWAWMFRKYPKVFTPVFYPEYNKKDKIEALQKGSQVAVKFGNSISHFTGTLIGFTSNAVFIKDGRTVHVLVEKGGGVSSCGRNISLMSIDDVIMFGNKVGIKRGSTIHLYDEQGKPAGTRQA